MALTVELSCLNTHVFILSDDQTLAVGLVVNATGPTVIHFDGSTPNVEFVAYRGVQIRGEACLGPANARPSGERLEITSGSGTLTLDATDISGDGDRFTTTELHLSDGTIITPIDIRLGCAGCLPS